MELMGLRSNSRTIFARNDKRWPSRKSNWRIWRVLRGKRSALSSPTQYSPATSVALQLARALHCRSKICSVSNKAGKSLKANCSALCRKVIAPCALR